MLTVKEVTSFTVSFRDGQEGGYFSGPARGNVGNRAVSRLFGLDPGAIRAGGIAALGPQYLAGHAAYWAAYFSSAADAAAEAANARSYAAAEAAFVEAFIARVDAERLAYYLAPSNVAELTAYGRRAYQVGELTASRHLHSDAAEAARHAFSAAAARRAYAAAAEADEAEPRRKARDSRCRKAA